jgi:hypothetical protein
MLIMANRLSQLLRRAYLDTPISTYRHQKNPCMICTCSLYIEEHFKNSKHMKLLILSTDWSPKVQLLDPLFTPHSFTSYNSPNSIHGETNSKKMFIMLSTWA